MVNTLGIVTLMMISKKKKEILAILYANDIFNLQKGQKNCRVKKKNPILGVSITEEL